MQYALKACPRRTTRAVRDIAGAVLNEHGQDNHRVTIRFVDDTEIRQLNATFRNRDKATNVLSFPGTGKPITPRSKWIELGDIAISPRYAQREAEADEMDAQVRVAHLIIHGVLHLLGFDHADASQQAVMERTEDVHLSRLDAATLNDLTPLLA